MVFTSFNFLIFFPIVVVLYNLVPQQWKRYFLLVVSYFFYVNMQPVYALLLVGITLFTYFGAKFIALSKSDKCKYRLLICSIVAIIAPLLFFKYFSFINNSILNYFVSIGIRYPLPEISLLLPVGISFYTFMAIGYVVDVYNEEIDFEGDFASTALFLAFFPLVLSGPIERANNMFPQFNSLKNSSYDDLASGFRLMLWGYFMKLCVADRLGLYVDAVFNNFEQHNGTTLMFASVLYPFQVYADLGGYSLIAIGVARAMGIAVIPNFNRPFFATSMSEFWRRWHMSLIQWLTDYIYTPLSFALRGWQVWGIVAALMLTFVISGIWHGAALTFIVWGVVQGIYLSIEALLQKRRTKFEKRHNLTKKWWYISFWCVVVFVLFAFSQIFGRCASLDDAWRVIVKIFTEHGKLNLLEVNMLIFAAFSFVILAVKDFVDEFIPSYSFLNHKNIIYRYIAYVILLSIILVMGVLDGSQFIYFQF